MSKDLEGVVQLQLDLFGRIARASENLRKTVTAKISQGLLEARLQILESNWSKCEAQHDKMLAQHWKELLDDDYRKHNLHEPAEEAYLLQKGLFIDAIRERSTKEVTAPPSVVAGSTHPPRTTLPRIQLPQFSGRYEDWPAFRDSFQSLIGKDVSTTPVEKLHYLKACLKGEAELLIRSLPITDENFDRAWKVLTDYYENKRLLVRSYISKFTALQRLKGESASDLRELYHRVRSTVGALESIGRPINKSDDLFVYLIVELLDHRSRREWETSISESTEPPSYAELQLFLDRRLHMLSPCNP